MNKLKETKNKISKDYNKPFIYKKQEEEIKEEIKITEIEKPEKEKLNMNEYQVSFFLNKGNVDACDIYPKLYAFAKKHVTDKTQKFLMERLFDIKTKKIKCNFYIDGKLYN